jgi:hypothetical protein
MANFVDYNQILTDLVTLLTAQVPSAQKIGKNLDARDYTFGQMPLIDVRLKQAVPDLTGQQNYYVRVVVEVEIACHDLSSRDEAAILRDNLLNQVHRAVQTNARFGSVIDSTEIGPVEFETQEDVDTGAFVSAAVAQLSVYIYSQG